MFVPILSDCIAEILHDRILKEAVEDEQIQLVVPECSLKEDHLIMRLTPGEELKIVLLSYLEFLDATSNCM